MAESPSGSSMHPAPPSVTSIENSTSHATHNSAERRSTSPPKKKRIHFTTGWDKLLQKVVTAVDGHRLQFGKLQATFEEALALFLGSAPADCFNWIQKPSWKTLSDRFKKMEADHRAAVKHNAAASGIAEVRGEREVPLDDIVLEMDECDEQERIERDEKTELDKRLAAAGVEMLEMAMNRVVPTPKEVELKDGEVHRAKRRVVEDPCSHEDQERFATHVSMREESDNKRLKHDQERLALDRKKDERESVRLRRAQDHESRVFALCEKRIELEIELAAFDREERKYALAERKQIIGVLGALPERLK